jgi:methylglutaconyl-CoA hydratase
MSEALVRYSIDGPAAVLTIDRAAKRNALSRALIAELTATVQRALADSAARCLILTGAGPTFCAGMDLGELAETLSDSVQPEVIWEDATKLAALFDLISTSAKPTIAAVNGPAVAGGAGLVSVCDLAIAVPAAKFGYPEVRRGLVAALVMPPLLRHVGERLARYLLLTGELIDADTAAHAGLINRVVPEDALLSEAMVLARAIAQGGPEALATTKALLARCSRQAVSLEELARASAAPRLGAECRAGLEAFFAKRNPPWADPAG